MTKIRIYTLLVVALLLVASPWLSTPEVKAAETTKSCCCCEGPCQGCCATPAEKNDSNTTKCKCELSDIPVIPDQPIEVVDSRPDYQLTKDVSVDQEIVYYKPKISYYKTPSGVSPPDEFSPPLYIINTSFLI